MTREEAITNYIIPAIERTWNEKICKEILEALKQAPCEDAIGRQAVMDCFEKWRPYMATRLWDFEKELSELPSVNPQPKTAHWIDRFGGCECSKCGYSEPGYSDYCPNCGRRMLESQESEE